MDRGCVAAKQFRCNADVDAHARLSRDLSGFAFDNDSACFPVDCLLFGSPKDLKLLDVGMFVAIRMARYAEAKLETNVFPRITVKIEAKCVHSFEGCREQTNLCRD